MLLNCYPRPVDLLVPEMSDPILRRMDWILEDARIHALIRKDLALHYKDTKDGRRPIPVEVTKRTVVLKRYKKWSYRNGAKLTLGEREIMYSVVQTLVNPSSLSERRLPKHETDTYRV